MDMSPDYRPVADVRRENLERVIQAVYGGVALRLAESLGIAPPNLGRVRKTGKWAQNIGDQMARNIERVSSLPDGWMDYPHDEMHGLFDQLKELDPKQVEVIRTLILSLRKP